MKGKADEKCMWRDYFGDLLNFKDEREAELSYLMKREVRGEKRGELVIVVRKECLGHSGKFKKKWEIYVIWNYLEEKVSQDYTPAKCLYSKGRPIEMSM